MADFPRHVQLGGEPIVFNGQGVTFGLFNISPTFIIENFFGEGLEARVDGPGVRANTRGEGIRASVSGGISAKVSG